jgi:hypothetical protein
MDIRRSDGPRVVEHGGTCTTRFYVAKEELREPTMGGYFELLSRFRLEPGTQLEPHMTATRCITCSQDTP